MFAAAGLLRYKAFQKFVPKHMVSIILRPTVIERPMPQARISVMGSFVGGQKQRKRSPATKRKNITIDPTAAYIMLPTSNKDELHKPSLVCLRYACGSQHTSIVIYKNRILSILLKLRVVE